MNSIRFSCGSATTPQFKGATKPDYDHILRQETARAGIGRIHSASLGSLHYSKSAIEDRAQRAYARQLAAYEAQNGNKE
jgi:hypothetical protein